MQEVQAKEWDGEMFVLEEENIIEKGAGGRGEGEEEKGKRRRGRGEGEEEKGKRKRGRGKGEEEKGKRRREEEGAMVLEGAEKFKDGKNEAEEDDKDMAEEIEGGRRKW